MILVFLLSIKLVVLADKSVVVQNKVEMNLISHNPTCDLIKLTYVAQYVIDLVVFQNFHQFITEMLQIQMSSGYCLVVRYT